MESIYSSIASLGKKYKASKIVLFGSRARGDHRDRSDIDIAVYCMPEKNRTLFCEEIEALPTLIDFDIIYVSEKTNTKLIENIERDGILLMSKFEEKLGKFKSAVDRLEEGLNDYQRLEMSAIRDGVIKRFEFCTELSWKTVREYLIDVGYSDINSPKAVMKQAFSDGIINDELLWIEILNSRNNTAHIYDEETALETYNDIKSKYISAFKALLHVLCEK